MNQAYPTTITPPKPTLFQQLAALRIFLLIWAGQVVSLTGSSMTGFALGVWVFQQTGSATSFALTLLFVMLPRTIVSPFAGLVADRWDRRWIMILSDTGAGASTLATAALLLSGQMQVWHIYLLTAVNSAFGALQGPAFGAAITLLVPKAHYGRVNGLVQLGGGIGQIIAPVLAGLLIGFIGLQGVLFIDMTTFLFAVATLLVVRFPQPETAPEGAAGQSSWTRRVWKGWCYLVTRPGPMGLVLIFALGNFFVGSAEALLTPMILRFTSPDTLGVMLSIGGVGLLVGSVLMSIWGGGRRKVYTVFGAYAVLGFAVVTAGLSPSVPLVTVALFVAFLAVPMGIGASQAILQVKVAPEVQGRVFSLRQMLNTASFAIAYLIAGPLADTIFEPLLAVDGLLAGSVGQVIGVGPGRGMGLTFIVMGFFAVITALSAFGYPRIRNVESELPDAVEN
jgi:DHA3 family macrolide efflux protein-like MFS transporter